MELHEGKAVTPPVSATYVNWKGLYNDSKASWNALFVIIFAILITVFYLTYQGYFTHREVGQQIEKITVLEVLDFFGKKVLVKGNITGSIPLEIPLPRDCIVKSNWIGKDILVNVVTQYKQYNNSEYYEFRNIEQICK